MSTMMTELAAKRAMMLPQEGGALEKHLTVKEIAASWHLKDDTVRKIFQEMPGVLKIGSANPRRKRRSYVSLRIPVSVMQRVYTERTK